MSRHFLELALRPSRDRVNAAVLITHEIEITKGNVHRLGSHAKEAANIDDDRGAITCAVEMIDLTNLMGVRSIDVAPTRTASVSSVSAKRTSLV